MYRSDYKEAVCIWATIFGVAGAVTLLIVLSVNCYSLLVYKPACEAYGVMSNQKTYYSLGTSCLVERNGEWVEYNVAVGMKQEITVKSK